MKKTGMADLYLDSSISVEFMGQLTKEDSVDLYGKNFRQTALRASLV